MKALLKQHQKALRWGLLALLALWCLWYARPLDIYDLLGGESPEYLSISVYPQFSFPEVIHGNLTFAAGDPEMDELLERLEEIRFHRNPLEVVLQFLPQGDRTTEVDPEKDYRIYFFAYDEQGHFSQCLQFDLTFWRHWNFQMRSLPLYVFQGQEKGRELGAWLWELSRQQYY